MIRRPPRSTQSRSSAASDVYKRQLLYARIQNPLSFLFLISSLLATLFPLLIAWGIHPYKLRDTLHYRAFYIHPILAPCELQMNYYFVERLTIPFPVSYTHLTL